MIDITPELREAIENAGEKPLRLIDPETHVEYVLPKADQYDCVRSLISNNEDINSEAMASHMWDVMKADWDDPVMDGYDRDPEVE